jgi:glycosyltransferase involved in cell wall biosynthesis
MIKVLFVSAVAERGGMEVILRNILTELDRTQFSPRVLCLADGPFVQELENTGTPVTVFRAGRFRHLATTVKTVRRTIKLIQDERIDVVHTLNSKAHVYGGWSAAMAGVPCCYHLHGVPRPTLTRDGVVSVLSFIAPAQRTVACSKYVATEFGHAWRSHRNIAVIHNGITLPVVNDAGLDAREEFGIPATAPLVMMACRFQRSKGVHVFLDAAVAVALAVPEARFVVVGGPLFGLDEDYPAELHDQATRLGLADRVVFTGFRADVYRLLGAADVVVHSSIEPDSFPTVILEAAVMGKPVVASDLGGPAEIIQHDVTGILIPPNDRECLAEAIVELLRDPKRRLEMGRAGGTRVREHFAAEHMARKFGGMYQQLHAGHSDARV